MKNLPVNNDIVFWSMAYKMSDAVMNLEDSGVLKSLAEKSWSVEDLAAHHSIGPEALSSLLNILTYAGILDKDESGYRLKQEQISRLPVVTMEKNARNWHSDNQSLKKAIHGESVGDPLDTYSTSEKETYYSAMQSAIRNVGIHIARSVDISNVGKIVDLGGGDGELARFLAKYSPNAHFCVVDRPENELFFNDKNSSGSNSVSYQGLDLNHPHGLVQILENTDIVIMSNLLHMLTPEAQRTLLSDLHRFLKKGATIVVYDQFLEAQKGITSSHLMVVDWINCGGGFDFTPEDFGKYLSTLNYSDINYKYLTQGPGALVWAKK